MYAYIDILFDILCIISGGYLIYAAIVMRNKGKIISNVVLKNGMDETSIRDKDGFIHYLYGRLILFGIIIILASVTNLINGRMNGTSVITLITYCIMAAAIVGYGLITSKALKKYTK